jgi:hypothetical protein
MTVPERTPVKQGCLALVDWQLVGTTILTLTSSGESGEPLAP